MRLELCDKYEQMLRGKYPVSGQGGAPLFPADRKAILMGLVNKARSLENAQGDTILGFVAGALWSFGSYTPEELEVTL